MTAVRPRPDADAPSTPSRPVTDIDRRRVLKYGGLAALTLVFVASIGMLETFDRRILVKPILSLGYVSLGWIPIAFGFIAAKEEIQEGVPEPVKGPRDLLAGFLVGIMGGFGLWLLAVVVHNFDLREIFPKFSLVLVDLLTFGRGFGFGFLALVLGCGVLGLLGGAGNVMSERARRGFVGALSWTFVVAVLEQIVEDMFDEIRLTFVAEFLYDINGALTVVGAAVVAVTTGFLSWRYAGGVNRYRTKVRAMDGAERRRYGGIAFLVVVVLAVVLPMILGSLVNELLANVGLFLLMGLGLNVVVGYAGLLDLGYVAFFAVGAYTTAVLTSPISPSLDPQLTVDFLSWEGWAVFGSVVVVAIIAGLLVGTPVIRMRGDYLAIVTLGFGEIVRLLFLSDWLSPTFGGAQGVRQIPAAELEPLGVEISGINPQSIFYFVAVFVGIAIYVSWRLSRSRVGRAWAALREDESVAEAMDGNRHRQGEAPRLRHRSDPRLVWGHGLRHQGRVGVPQQLRPVGLDHRPRGGDRRRHGEHPRRHRRRAGTHRGPRRTDAARSAPGVPGVQAVDLRSAARLHDVAASRRALTERPPHPGAPPGGVPPGRLALVGARRGGGRGGGRGRRHRRNAVTKLLEISGLEKAFGGLRALGGIDFHVDEGEIVSVIGPNGAGKTTFFNAISGMLPSTGSSEHRPVPDSGSIVFHGENITGLAPSEITKRGIGRTFQNVRLFPNMTVLENVMVAQHSRTRQGVFGAIFQTPAFRREEKQIEERAKEVLSFFGSRLVGYRFDQPAFVLSYANRRRLEVARAMATDPRLLLLDEPTAGMNPKETAELTMLINRMRDDLGLTIVVIEHEMRVVRDVSDRVVVLDHGVKIAEGTYEEVSTDEAVIEAYLGADAGGGSA